MQRAILVLCVLSCVAFSASAEPAVDAAVSGVMPKVVAWRRDIHAHPELGNRETRTAKLVADHLRSLKLEVRTGVAHTGVVGVLRGGKPGPVIAMRADMDALPVTEQVDVPFKSLVRTEYRGEQVGVMHACGHDGHTAILMGVAQVLASMRAQLPGTVVFVFQPAEEGAPDGEEGGSKLMLKENALDPRPEAMFGLHLWATIGVGDIGYRLGPRHGRVGHVSHGRDGTADTRRAALARRRSDRHGGADHYVDADGGQPSDRHHADAGRRDRGRDQGRYP